MPERLPTSALLRSGSPAQRDLVRVTFTVSRFLGFRVESATKKLMEGVRDKAPTRAGAYVIASPEISGGTFVLDMAIIKAQSVGRLSRALEALGRGITVEGVERITRGELASAERGRTAERRQAVVEEADEARAARANTLAGFARKAVQAGKVLRGVVILVVIGGALFVAAPFLKTASKSLDQLAKKRRRSRG